MKVFAGLLLLCLLAAPALTASCSSPIAGCADCDTSSPQKCNYCSENYWKSADSTCTACPAGTGRGTPYITVAVETAAVCLKCNPALNCNMCSDTPNVCDDCPAGNFKEYFLVSGMNTAGCSTNCSAFSPAGTNLLPQDAATNPPKVGEGFCKTCGITSQCLKCQWSATLKQFLSSPAAGAYECLQCNPTYYLAPHPAGATTYAPLCLSCGINCASCKDRKTCNTCVSGFGGNKDGDCLDKVASSASLIQAFFVFAATLFFAF